MKLANFVTVLICVVSQVPCIFCRIRNLTVEDDERNVILLSTFGFYEKGTLDMQLKNFKLKPYTEDDVFGFSFERSLYDDAVLYPNHSDLCQHTSPYNQNVVFYATIDLKEKSLEFKCNNKCNPIEIYRTPDARFIYNMVFDNEHVPIKVHVGSNGMLSYDIGFFVDIKLEGVYSLYFHNCPNYGSGKSVGISFQAQINEENDGNYLSVTEMALPALYYTMAVIFLISGMFWIFLLCQPKHLILNIHYLMTALILLKAFSLTVHAAKYDFAEIVGDHWIPYYVTHALTEVLLLVTVALIGTGWTFMKNLRLRDKVLISAIVLLQASAHVTAIFNQNKTLSIVLDFMCAICILVPAFWSLRHLKQTDAAATKIKLFKCFYIAIVFYIYFTRIISYLLKISVQFQYGYVDEMFAEVTTYLFFVFIGFKFQPAACNLYFPVSQKEQDDNYSITDSGLTEGVIKNRNK